MIKFANSIVRVKCDKQIESRSYYFKLNIWCFDVTTWRGLHENYIWDGIGLAWIALLKNSTKRRKCTDWNSENEMGWSKMRTALVNHF